MTTKKRPVKISAKKKVQKLSAEQLAGRNLALQILKDFVATSANTNISTLKYDISNSIFELSDANGLQDSRYRPDGETDFSVYNLIAGKLAKQKDFSNILKSVGVHFLNCVLDGLEQAEENNLHYEAEKKAGEERERIRKEELDKLEKEKDFVIVNGVKYIRE